MRSYISNFVRNASLSWCLSQIKILKGVCLSLCRRILKIKSLCRRLSRSSLYHLLGVMDYRGGLWMIKLFEISKRSARISPDFRQWGAAQMSNWMIVNAKHFWKWDCVIISNYFIQEMIIFCHSNILRFITKVWIDIVIFALSITRQLKFSFQ